MKWMLLTQEPTFFTFMVVTQEPTIRKMSAVTHAFHIMKWMLLTQEPTFFIFMVVTQEPTIRKCQLLLMYFTPWKYSLLKRYHHSKPKFRCQKFLRRSIHSCMRTCNKFSWGVCWDLEMSYFHPLYLPLFLTFHRPINLSLYHFLIYIWVSLYYFPLYSF